MTLIGQWDFREGTGTTVLDTSGSGNTATLRGTAGWGEGLRGIGRALAVDGSLNCAATVEFASNIGAITSLTMGGWCYQTAYPVSGYHTVCARENHTVGQQLFILGFFNFGANSLHAWYLDNSNVTHEIVVTTGIPALNTWYHQMMTFSAADGMRLYLNGVEIGNLAAVAPSSDSGTKFFIGAQGTGGAGSNTCQANWLGRLDNIRLYDAVLTPSQVHTLYLAGSGLSARARQLRPAPFKPGNAR